MGQAAFHTSSGVYRADTCAPLRRAAHNGDIDLWAYGRGSYPGQRFPRSALPGLRSVGLWEASTHQAWGLDWHRNEGIELTFVTGGRTRFSCGEQDFDLPSGTMTITRPWQLHRVGTPDITASTLCWFILDVGVRRPNQQWRWPPWLPLPDADLERITELLRHNEYPVWPSSKELTQAVNRLQRTLRGESTQPLSRIALYIGEILVETSDLLEQQQPELDPYLSSSERAVELFLHNLEDSIAEPWSIDTMAAECGIGKTRFVHYCRQLVNLTPLEYLTVCRLHRAKHLLASTDAKISDVAQKCGFQTSQYFSTVFRQHLGCPPSQYRSRLSSANGVTPSERRIDSRTNQNRSA